MINPALHTLCVEMRVAVATAPHVLIDRTKPLGTAELAHDAVPAKLGQMAIDRAFPRLRAVHRKAKLLGRELTVGIRPKEGKQFCPADRRIGFSFHV